LTLWNRKQIAEEVALLEIALKSRRFGSYTLQAALAAVPAERQSVAVTRLSAFYDRLAQNPLPPVVRLNRAVAIAIRDGPEAGLAHIDAILGHCELANDEQANCSRADLCRRLPRTADAKSFYKKALALTQQDRERQLL
jgi:RNA polymerase sigma-70 factor, ECF subfamily